MKKFIKRLFKLVWWLLILAIAWMVLPLDGLALRLINPQPTITRTSAESKTAFVFFTGAQHSAEAHSAPLRDLWSKHGDVVLVEYNRLRFDGRVTAYATYQQLRQWGYQRAILDGADMGGMLATDVIDFDRISGNHLKFAVLVQDAPLSQDDMHRQPLKGFLSKVWWPGWLTNKVATWPTWRLAYHPPEPYQLGTNVDARQLEADQQISRSYPLSSWKGEIRYMATHDGFLQNQYVGVPLVVMESEHDDVVMPNANDWKKIFGGGTVIKVPQSTHIGFTEYPDRWRTAYAAAFKALPRGW